MTYMFPSRGTGDLNVLHMGNFAVLTHYTLNFISRSSSEALDTLYETDDGAKPKLAKSMPRRCSIQGIYMRKKYICKNLGIKEGGWAFAQRGQISRNLWQLYRMMNIPV